MKKYLLPPVTYYKANLHTHSTVSDGKLEPEAVRDLYRNAGYSILALTDHSVTVAHQDLSTDDFVMLTGVEIDMDDRTDPKGDIRGRNRHLCLNL
jgi:predicted metal-dependent phosphoesterase TrpH